MKRTQFLTLLGSSALALLLGCSSSDETGNPGSPGTGAPIPADQVGGACSGVGTSPGDSALFKQPECAGGYCVADARKDFSTYCTADCESRSCPTGYSCEEVTFGDAKHACLKSGSGPAPNPGESEAGADAKAKGPIGTKGEKGVKSVDVDITSKASYTCGAACTAAGGKCNEGLGGNGVGYVNRKYNNGSGTTGNRISLCSQSEDYYSFNTTMTDMSCYCDDMKVPPTVRVTRADGLVACSAVCESWSLTCSASRKSYSYLSAKDDNPITLPCAQAPAALTDHYVCACD